MKGKLISIEGLDSSGKETQCKLLKEWLTNQGYNVISFSFPNYDSATGKIIAGAYLGKQKFGESLFKEGAFNVDPFCTAMLYAMDRKYNIDKINKYLNLGYIVLVDRYVESNIAYQCSKVDCVKKQEEIKNFIQKLEYEMLDMPKPDASLFLHLPYKFVEMLLSKRAEKADNIERDSNYLTKVEQIYVKLDNLIKIEMVDNNEILSIEEIHNLVINEIKKILN